MRTLSTQLEMLADWFLTTRLVVAVRDARPMKILFVTRRSEERAQLQAEAHIRAQEEALKLVATALAERSREPNERNERGDRLMAAIWAAHDAGQLPYELDSLLLNEWSDDRSGR